MTATLFLIRHAAHDQLGHVLSGRTPGLALSDVGRGQAARLARALGGHRFAAIYTSPVQRARETANAIAQGRDLVPQTAEALDEVDFGAWTGREFATLEGDNGWRRWNSARAGAETPGGETMRAAQARVVAFAEQLSTRHSGEAVGIVSHCDVIRALIAHHLGLSLDRLLSFEVDPASVSRLEIGPEHSRVLSINEALA